MQIQDLIKNQHRHHNSFLTAIFGFVTLALSASGMFNQIHSSFNSIWNIKAKPKSSILNYFTKHLVSFSTLVLIFFIMILSTSINSFLMKHAQGLHSDYRLSFIYEHIISFSVIAIMFFIMFKTLGNAKIHWKPALIGGLFTSLFFIIGKIGIGMLIAKSNLSTTFGTSSVLALIMMWVYYTSQIIFLGASFVKVISERLGYTITPDSDAVLIEHVEVSS